MSLPASPHVATDQVLYNLSRRAPEFGLFPACREVGIPVMAYSPVEQGRILGNPVLRDIATRLDASPVQVALAWVLRLDNICAIPRSGRPEHVYENRAALAIHLDRDALAALDAEFPPPLHAQPLKCSRRGRKAPLVIGDVDGAAAGTASTVWRMVACARSRGWAAAGPVRTCPACGTPPRTPVWNAAAGASGTGAAAFLPGAAAPETRRAAGCAGSPAVPVTPGGP